MTYEVGLSRNVRAFHVMPGLPGPEGQLHDHDYRIEIVVSRDQLDDRAMVCDLDVLEEALTRLTERIEGRNLEEIRPADAEAVTVEVFARWVHDALSAAIAAGRCHTGRTDLGNPGCVWRIPRTMLTICLITLGDPATLTGGYRYHRRMAELAAGNDARLTFASLPPRLPFRHGRRVLRAAAQADVVLVDSIAAAYLAPWIALRRPPRLIAIAHQPPGGIDHAPPRRWVQAWLDRFVYRRCDQVIVASALLAGRFDGRRRRTARPGSPGGNRGQRPAGRGTGRCSLRGQLASQQGDTRTAGRGRRVAARHAAGASGGRRAGRHGLRAAGDQPDR